MDSEREGGARTTPVDHGAEHLWIEILSPIETAGAAIAQALQELSAVPTGVFVAVSDQGTILLNQAGWTTFHTALKSVVSLQTQHPIGEVSTRTLKICVLT
jgi:hypothetical protein